MKPVWCGRYWGLLIPYVLQPRSSIPPLLEVKIGKDTLQFPGS